MDSLKIFLCGPHSTGKTTLLNDVIQHYHGIKVIDEVARGIIRDFGWRREDFLPEEHPETFYKLNEEIIKRQICQDIEYSKNGKGFICDRALDPLVYVKFYLGEEARGRLLHIEGITEWLQRMRSSFVFLLAPHKEIINDDNVRLVSTIDELHKLYQAFEEELLYHNIPYCKITELDRNARVQSVLTEIQGKLNASSKLV